jgi:hypothetical protein
MKACISVITKYRIIPIIVTVFCVCFLCLPIHGMASPVSSSANELKKKAQQDFISGRYADAETVNLEIVTKYPESKECQYAVQMLGTLYENNLVDLRKAIRWDREYLEKYADTRKVSFYKEKLISLEKLVQQEEVFRAYQKIRFANESDENMVKKFEALLNEHPDFILKDKVQSELGYAYARMDKREKSYLAFKALTRNGEKKLSTSDQVAFKAASRYWEETSTWGWVAWGVVVVFWVAVLLMKPWKQLTRSAIRNTLIVAFLWILLIAIRLPFFYSIETAGDPIKIPDTAVYIAAGLNLTILFWLLLLSRGKFWQTRPRALRWLGPVLTLVMTLAVFYLFIIHQPNGPQIMDVFADQYQDWAEDLKIL